MSMSWRDIWKLAKQGKLPPRNEPLTRTEHSYVNGWMQEHKYDEADLFYMNDDYMILGIQRK